MESQKHIKYLTERVALGLKAEIGNTKGSEGRKVGVSVHFSGKQSPVGILTRAKAKKNGHHLVRGSNTTGR